MKYRLFLLLLTVSLSVFGQRKGEQGYFVNYAGDTLTGLVKYKAGNEYILFYKEGQKAFRLSPDSVKAFGFDDGRIYIPQYISEELRFVQMLVEGKLSLYKTRDNFYAQRDDSLLVELKNEKRNLTVNGKAVTMDSREYVGMLSILMKDCEAVKSGLSDLKLAESALVEVVDEYNQCMGSPSRIAQEGVAWKVIQVGAAAGIHYSKLIIDENSGFISALGDVDPYWSVAIGGDITITDLRLNPRLALYTGMYFAQAKYRKEFGSNNNYKLDVSLSMLNIPLGIQYNILSGANLNIFIRGGMVNHIHVQNESSITYEYFNGEEDVIGYYEPYTTPSKVSIGLFGAAMLSQNLGENRSLFIDLRYERTNGVSESASISDYINTCQVVAGLRFRL